MFGDKDFIADSTNADIRKATGFTWAQWLVKLDTELAFNLSREEVVHRLKKNFRLTEEWPEKIATAYSEAMGIENKQQPRNEVEFTVTLTINASLQLIEQAFTDESVKQEWLQQQFTVLKHNPGKNLRLENAHKEIVLVNFFAKGPAKCQVGLNHSKLKDEAIMNERKLFWKETLADLARLVE